MPNKYLHIVDLDVPYPANYGAAIDMYCRLKSLKEMGVKIILHCFEYGRGKAKRLNDHCEMVYYYPRKSILHFPFQSEPYIVYSRRNDELFERLFADDFPVLLEGVHTCACLTDERYKQKKFFVRMHNVEHEYYRYLSESAHGFKKLYYGLEASRLKRFEKILDRAECLFSVSERDHATLSSIYPRVKYLPPFIYEDEIVCKPGRGTYIFYHGNLSVEENLKAAKYLINEVFPGLNMPFIVAGTKASELGKKNRNPHIEFVNSPNTADLKDLLMNAQINVLPTFQPTGIKHKLINSLFAGRFCVVNPPMVEGNGLEQFCYVAKDAVEMKSIIQELFKKEFSQTEIDRRKQTLTNIYSNRKNAEKLAEVIFGTK